MDKIMLIISKMSYVNIKIIVILDLFCLAAKEDFNVSSATINFLITNIK